MILSSPFFIHRARALPAGPARAAKGFTLIEILVVMLIVGLLLAVAMPNYRDHLQRAQRAQAIATLLQAQQFMERLYSVQGTYLLGEQAPTLPEALRSVSVDGRDLYRLSVEDAGVSSYRLQAVPQDALVDEPCGTLTLDHTGLKGRSGSGMSLQACWR